MDWPSTVCLRQILLLLLLLLLMMMMMVMMIFRSYHEFVTPSLDAIVAVIDNPCSIRLISHTHTAGMRCYSHSSHSHAAILVLIPELYAMSIPYSHGIHMGKWETGNYHSACRHLPGTLSNTSFPWSNESACLGLYQSR